MGGLFSDPGASAAKANKANVAKMMGIYENLYPQLMGSYDVAQGLTNQQLPIAQAATLQALNKQQGAATGAKVQAQASIRNAGSAAQQNLVSRGLGGSTIMPQIEMGEALSTSQAYAQIDQALADMQAGTLMQGAGMQTGALGNMAGVSMNRGQAQMGWGTGFAGALGGVQHTGGPSGFSQLLGLGAQLGSAYMLGGGLGAGAAAGGGAGAAMGSTLFFGSDRRIKENIERIGESPSGIPIYRFTYRHAPERVYEGTMSDEVRHIEGAVRSIGGIDFVDYARLDVTHRRVA